MNYAREAEACRAEALRHLGKPEAPFLLRVARAFDDLERRDSTRPASGAASEQGSHGQAGTQSPVRPLDYHHE